MAGIPPQVNTGSPGVPAGSNVGSGSNGQGTYSNKYNIPNMYVEQSGKNGIKKGQVSRFSLTCGNFVFKAHLDPNHLTDNQEKRLVQLDVLTGIVLQDFGYTAEIIEIRGTTGARYYQKILEMDSVFKNQSVAGTPTPSILTIEGRTYTGVWKSFQFDRRAIENTYSYDITFIVMSPGNISNPNPTSSAVIAANKVAVASQNANGQNQVTKVTNYAGKTPLDYLRANVPSNQRSAALAYLSANWSSAPENANSSFPGIKGRIQTGQVLVVPSSWSNVLSSVSSGVTQVSGNVNSVNVA